MRNLLFIINPRSGKKNSGFIIDTIKRNIPSSLSYEIITWKNLDEFKNVEERLSTAQYTDAIAVGGDGSVNLTGRTILNKNIALGIIPAGSGNGLARSLGYSIKTEEALQQVIEGKIATIDSGSVNGIPFFCTSGLGFDAHLGNLFANLPKRGLKSYIKIIFREFFSYRARNYTLFMNGEEYSEQAFLITVANAGQYGNNFYIAPEAKLDDGLFHVVILKSPGFLSSIGFITKVLRRKANTSSIIKTIPCKELLIKRSHDECIHFDGEPDLMGKEIKYVMHPKSLKVIVGESFWKNTN